MSLTASLKQRALEIGFDLVGVAPLAAWKDLEFSRRWVEKGFGGEMRYLENPSRDDPRRILPSVQSVVCVGLVYNAPLPYSTEVGSRGSAVGSRSDGQRTTDDGPRAWISRYAWGSDYHELMRGKLEALRASIDGLAPNTETRVYVDTGPIVERAFARYSGIGWAGKNTCLINQQKGSWFFLGVVLTSLALEPDLPAPDRCGSCTRCLEACPTGALVEPYVMDASRCIAYLNIELKGSIPAEFRPAIGANVFGCDICQDVCPWNSRQSSVVSRQLPEKGYGRAGAATTSLAEFQPLTVVASKLGIRNSKLETGKSKPENHGDESPKSDLENHRQSTIINRKLSNPESRRLSPESRSNRPSSIANRQFSGTDSRLPTPDSRSFSLFNPRLEDLATLSEEEFRAAFRHSPLKRAKYRGWLRNVCVAMGNSGDARFIPKLRELAAHSDPIVREHAEWALERLGWSAKKV
jgi:epoxyqueuosine reductase